MIFGGTQFSNDSVQNSNCTDVTNSEFNCTTVKVTSFTSFDIGLYSLYRATFGNSLDETNMGLVDDIMTNILIGTFLGFTALVLVNIFIAILTNTVNRVWEKAVAYVILQRACVIVSQEKGWSYDQHKDHVKYLTESQLYQIIKEVDIEDKFLVQEEKQGENQLSDNVKSMLINPDNGRTHFNHGILK